MMNFPVVKLEIEGMRHALHTALSEHALLLDTTLKEAIDSFCEPQNIRAIIMTKAHQQMRVQVEQAVTEFFTYGEGRKAISEEVKKRLLEELEGS